MKALRKEFDNYFWNPYPQIWGLHVHKNWQQLSNSWEQASVLWNSLMCPPARGRKRTGSSVKDDWSLRYIDSIQVQDCNKGNTWTRKATTKTVTKRVAVSKSWKFKSIGRPMIHPITTQNGIYNQITISCRLWWRWWNAIQRKKKITECQPQTLISVLMNL